MGLLITKVSLPQYICLKYQDMLNISSPLKAKKEGLVLKNV